MLQVKDFSGSPRDVKTIEDFQGQRPAAESLSVVQSSDAPPQATEATSQDVKALCDTVLLLVETIRNQMPMPDQYDRMRVTIEAGSVGIASSQTLQTVGNAMSLGNYVAAGCSFSGYNIPALQLITNQITVTV